MDIGKQSPRLARDVRYRVVGDEAVVVCQDCAEVLVLNAPGSRILAMLAEGRSAEEIRVALLTEYDVEEPRLREDLDRFIEELVESGILVAGTKE